MKCMTAKDIRKILPRRKKDSHKWDNGSVLCVGGSEEYVSAIIYAGMAAYRSGCDIVTIAAPSRIAWAIHAHNLDLLTIKYKGTHFQTKHVKDIVKQSEKFDVVLLGPGLGMKSASFVKRLVKELVKRKKRLVIDADALKVVRLKDVDNAILTPHKREFEILMKNSKMKSEDMKRLQKELKSNVLLLKGAADTIISAKSICYNRTGNAGMTAGGTGDVLAGLCAGLYAQTKDAVDAARIAAYVNGAAGDICLKKRGYGFTASDVLEECRTVLREFGQMHKRI